VLLAKLTLLSVRKNSLFMNPKDFQPLVSASLAVMLQNNNARVVVAMAAAVAVAAVVDMAVNPVKCMMPFAQHVVCKLRCLFYPRVLAPYIAGSVLTQVKGTNLWLKITRKKKKPNVTLKTPVATKKSQLVLTSVVRSIALRQVAQLLPALQELKN
jgi:hypothetical protein